MLVSHNLPHVSTYSLWLLNHYCLEKPATPLFVNCLGGYRKPHVQNATKLKGVDEKLIIKFVWPNAQSSLYTHHGYKSIITFVISFITNVYSIHSQLEWTPLVTVQNFLDVIFTHVLSNSIQIGLHKHYYMYMYTMQCIRTKSFLLL